MAIRTRLRLLYLLHLSKPAYNRPVYRAISQGGVCTILELGLGKGQRALRMIEVAGGPTSIDRVSYTGVDLFEARAPGAGPRLTLKEAHRLLRPTGARIRLLPGDPLAALRPVVNGLERIDLVIVSLGLDAASLARTWYYLPRVLHSRSLVMVEEPTGLKEGVRVRLAAPREVRSLAAKAAPGRQAA